MKMSLFARKYRAVSLALLLVAVCPLPPGAANGQLRMPLDPPLGQSPITPFRSERGQIVDDWDFLRRGELLIELGRYPDAENAELVQEIPAAEVIWMQARRHYQEKQFESCASLLKDQLTAIEKDQLTAEDATRIYRLLAMALIEAGQLEEALRARDAGLAHLRSHYGTADWRFTQEQAAQDDLRRFRQLTAEQRQQVVDAKEVFFTSFRLPPEDQLASLKLARTVMHQRMGGASASYVDFLMTYVEPFQHFNPLGRPSPAALRELESAMRQLAMATRERYGESHPRYAAALLTQVRADVVAGNLQAAENRAAELVQAVSQLPTTEDLSPARYSFREVSLTLEGLAERFTWEKNGRAAVRLRGQIADLYNSRFGAESWQHKNARLEQELTARVARLSLQQQQQFIKLAQRHRSGGLFLRAVPGQAERSITEMSRSLAEQRRLVGRFYRHTAWTLHKQAGIRLSAGDLHEAIRLLREALRVVEDEFGKSRHPMRLQIFATWDQAYQRLAADAIDNDKPETAAGCFRQMQKLRSIWLGEGHWYVNDTERTADQFSTRQKLSVDEQREVQELDLLLHPKPRPIGLCRAGTRASAAGRPRTRETSRRPGSAVRRRAARLARRQRAAPGGSRHRTHPTRPGRRKRRLAQRADPKSSWTSGIGRSQPQNRDC